MGSGSTTRRISRTFTPGAKRATGSSATPITLRVASGTSTRWPARTSIDCGTEYVSGERIAAITATLTRFLGAFLGGIHREFTLILKSSQVQESVINKT